MSTTNQALGHLKVLEFCDSVSGPYCTKLLADLGAEVIKIETPDIGDESRRFGPFLNDVPDQDHSGLFLYLNTNKLSITLDVSTNVGRRIFKELIKQTDILVEDKLSLMMETLGFTYEELKKINPHLVMTSITPFGQTGPYSNYRSYQLNSYHAGGEGYMLPIESSYSDREPLKGGGLVGDCSCGLSASLATLAAVYCMNQTGIGQQVDVSKQDVLMTLAGLEIAMYSNTGVVRNRHPRPAMMGLPIECEDGHIIISAFTDRDFQTFAEYMGNKDWMEDERFSNMMGRWQNANEVNEKVEEWVKQYKKEELFHHLQENVIACAPVNTAEDLVNSPQIEDRGFLSEIDHPKAGKLKYPGVPYKLSETPCNYEHSAPILGQHNELVYCERLGYTKHELIKLKESAVI